jgi:hypothetical protein
MTQVNIVGYEVERKSVVLTTATELTIYAGSRKPFSAILVELINSGTQTLTVFTYTITQAISGNSYTVNGVVYPANTWVITVTPTLSAATYTAKADLAILFKS